MNFHTFELVYKTPYHEYKDILNDMIQYCKLNKKRFYNPDKKSGKGEEIINNPNLATTKEAYKQIRCEALNDIGIEIIFNNYILKPTVYFGLRIIVNPKKVIERNNNVDITNSDEVELFISRFNKEVAKLSDSFPEFDDFSLSRIDYCFNNFFNDQEQAETIMKIFKRAYKVNKYKEYTEFDKIKKRYISPNDSIHLSSKSMKINIYLKHNEMLNKEKKYKKEFKDINRTLGLMRFEIQCETGKLHHLKKKFKLESLKARDFFRNEIYQYVFTSYFKKVFGTGSFLKYNEARDIINCSEKLNKKNKLILLEFLKVTNKKRNVNDAILELINLGYKKDDIKNGLKMFDSIGINIVTIPRTYEFNQLKNPIEFIR